MQQLLILRRNPARCRNRRHRLHALAALRCHKAHTIVMQRSRSIRVSDHARQLLDILGKPRFTILRSFAGHVSLPWQDVNLTK